VPEDTDQLYGVVPPVAANVWLYDVPAVPAGSGLAVVIVRGVGTSTMVTTCVAVRVAPPEV
jgi:hypothetical protein